VAVGDKEGDGSDGTSAHGVGDEHGESARDPVDDHTSSKGEAHCRDRPGGEDIGETGRAAVDPERFEGERDREYPVAERRDGLARPQQGEVALF
jgi:hypothetical protein